MEDAIYERMGDHTRCQGRKKEGKKVAIYVIMSV